MELNELNGEIFCNRKVNDIRQFSMEKIVADRRLLTSACVTILMKEVKE